jgi:hypothetical protein
MSTLGGGNYCKFPLIKRDWSLILAYLQGDRVMRDSVGPAQKATNKRVMGFPESCQRIENLQAELLFFFFFSHSNSVMGPPKVRSLDELLVCTLCWLSVAIKYDSFCIFNDLSQKIMHVKIHHNNKQVDRSSIAHITHTQVLEWSPGFQFLASKKLARNSTAVLICCNQV